MHKRFSVFVGTLIAAGVLVGSGSASAPTSANCLGQFYSSHAGIVPATGGEISVGSFVSVSVRESEVPPGQQISAVTQFPREDCGL